MGRLTLFLLMLIPTACTNVPLIVVDDRYVMMPVVQIVHRREVILDLHEINIGNGSLVLRRQTDHVWPRKLIVRVDPASMRVLYVRGRYQMRIPVPGKSCCVDLRIARRIYSDETGEIIISYRR